MSKEKLLNPDIKIVEPKIEIKGKHKATLKPEYVQTDYMQDEDEKPRTTDPLTNPVFSPIDYNFKGRYE